MSSARSRQHIADDGFDEVLGQLHVVEEFIERHLGLDHPELGEMPSGVRVLGAEGRSEGVDRADSCGERFAFELAADCERGFLAEEVLGVVDGGSSGRESGLFSGPLPAATLSRSIVVTWNISPAPSQSLVVMIGVWTYRKPRS